MIFQIFQIYLKNQEVDTDERDGNTEIKDKARNVEKSENEATVIREFEEIIRSKKKKKISHGWHTSKAKKFSRFKEEKNLLT